MSFPFVAENEQARKTLMMLAERLSDEDLALVTPYGWTIGALFAHMAWWDQRMIVLLRRWREKGVDESPVDSEAVNEALKPLCHAMDPRVAIRLCLESAKQSDAELSAMSPMLLAEIETSPNHFRVNRALHRNDHIRDILSLVPAARGAGGA